jgi:hypothetical protein
MTELEAITKRLQDLEETVARLVELVGTSRTGDVERTGMFQIKRENVPVASQAAVAQYAIPPEELSKLK